MKFTETPLKDAYLVEPVVHGDHRGFFIESYSQRIFEENGFHLNFIQDNHARSEKLGVLRGLHFQTPPNAQTKLVRVIRGKVFDAIVDIRIGSPTYGQSYGVELSEDNFHMLLVPVGFAHGYCTLTPGAEVMYKVDTFYAPQAEGGIIWNDPALQIDWQVEHPILSSKDQQLPPLSQFNSPFAYPT